MSVTKREIQKGLISELIPSNKITREIQNVLYLSMWFVYLLLCDNQTFYTGLTNNLDHRLKQHQNYHSTFTKRFKEIKLIYSEEFENKNIAALREKEIKGWNRQKKLSLIK